MSLDLNIIEELFCEQLISNKAKIETFLSLALELRPASQLILPTELPNGMEMSRKIDQNVQPYMRQLQKIQDLKTKALAVQAVKELLERNFELIVEESDEYKALYDWTNRIGLRNNQLVIRPTVHEIFFYNNIGTGRKIKNLMREREKIRRKVQRKPDKNINRFRFAFPEEFEPEWLHKIGNVLGYPECCVKQYAYDRGNGINVEIRAAKQLIEAVKDKVDTHVYFTSNFLPCNPRCEKALSIGYNWYKNFKELNSDLGRKYEQNLVANAEIVLRQPELIQNYLSQFETK